MPSIKENLAEFISKEPRPHTLSLPNSVLHIPGRKKDTSALFQGKGVALFQRRPKILFDDEEQPLPVAASMQWNCEQLAFGMNIRRGAVAFAEIDGEHMGKSMETRISIRA